MPCNSINGIYVALITPFSDDQSVHGLVPGGSTGEFTALTFEERKQLVQAVITSAKGRVGIMAGTGDLSTSKTVELAKHATEAGADSLMVVPPFYDAPNLTELKEHLREIHTVSDLPIVYYNIPAATGLTLTTAEIASLREVGVYYVKDTSGNASALTDMLFSDGITSRVTVFNGWDTLTFCGLAAGAKESVWGASNILPELSLQLWDAVAVRGDLTEGRRLWKLIFPVCRLLESGNYASSVKTGMELRGWKTGGMRKPYVIIKGDARARLSNALKDAGISVTE